MKGLSHRSHHVIVLNFVKVHRIFQSFEQKDIFFVFILILNHKSAMHKVQLFYIKNQKKKQGNCEETCVESSFSYFFVLIYHF